ncbi:MAG: hypothetical protein ACYDD4_04800 [Acidimicrobiales bacterium]
MDPSVGAMERVLVAWCPSLVYEDDTGRPARALAAVVDTMTRFSPFTRTVRPGVVSMATRGPSRYFGGDEPLARLVVAEIRLLQPDATVAVADGTFAALAAARLTEDEILVVPVGHSAQFLSVLPVDMLERTELANLLHRLGIHTLGRFAQIPTRHVLGRLGADAAECQAVARAERGELSHPPRSSGARGSRRKRAPNPRATAHPSATHKSPVARSHVRQPGFWGGNAGARRRADTAVQRVIAMVGPESVTVGRLQGGRAPAERGRLVPWDARHMTRPERADAPWPGRLPSPSPVVIPATSLPAELLDAAGNDITVTASAMLGTAPARLSVNGGPFMALGAWAGPWPIDEGWWSGRGRRRKARLQVLTAGGMAALLVRERGRWWVEGVYD